LAVKLGRGPSYSGSGTAPNELVASYRFEASQENAFGAS
jgi:hypothetical protein